MEIKLSCKQFVVNTYFYRPLIYDFDEVSKFLLYLLFCLFAFLCRITPCGNQYIILPSLFYCEFNSIGIDYSRLVAFLIKNICSTEPCRVYKIILCIAYPRRSKDFRLVLNPCGLFFKCFCNPWANNIAVFVRD